MAVITEKAWLDELERLSRKNDDGMTSEEWCASLNRGSAYVKTMLKRAKAMGWLAVGRKTREGLDGRMYQAVVYRVVKPKKS